jgi:hypothetical protein
MTVESLVASDLRVARASPQEQIPTVMPDEP